MSATSNECLVSPWATRDPIFHQIKEAEDALRQRIMEREILRNTAAEETPDPYESLIEITPELAASTMEKFKAAREANIASRDPQRLSIISYNQARRSGVQRKTVANVSTDDSVRPPHPLNIQALHARFLRIFNSLFSGMSKSLLQHIVVAGGAALYHVMGMGRVSDIDIFIVDTDEPNKILQDIINYLGGSSPAKRGYHIIDYCLRTEHSVTLKLCNRLTLQIVLRAYRTPAEVVIGFDLDASGCCIHMGKIYCTPRALYALETACQRVDLSRRSTTYHLRLVKYAKEKYFSIDIPVEITVRHINEALHLYSRYFVCPRKYVTNRHILQEMRSREVLNGSLIGLLVTHYLGQQAIRHPSFANQSDYCPVDLTGVKNHKQTGIKFFRVNDIEGIKTTGYGFRTKYLSPHYVHDLGALTPYLEKSRIPLDGVKPVAEFMTKNPGTQFTASFHPEAMTWEAWLSLEIELDLDLPTSTVAPPYYHRMLAIPTTVGLDIEADAPSVPPIPTLPPIPALPPIPTLPPIPALPPIPTPPSTHRILSSGIVVTMEDIQILRSMGLR